MFEKATKQIRRRAAEPFSIYRKIFEKATKFFVSSATRT